MHFFKNPFYFVDRMMLCNWAYWCATSLKESIYFGFSLVKINNSPYLNFFFFSSLFLPRRDTVLNTRN